MTAGSPQALIHPFELHDGLLTGISVGAKHVELRCLHETGDILLISIKGITRFRATDFLEGNTINRISIYCGVQCPSDLIPFVFQMEDKPDHPALIEARTAVLLGRSVVLELEPSYGCYAVALAEGGLSSISVERHK